MWYSIILLLGYLLVLLMTALILELDWMGSAGILAGGITTPLALGMGQLQYILESRGISSATAVERKDVIQLVTASGEIHNGELMESETARYKEHTLKVSEKAATSFSGATHFMEVVEDSKDSAWLIQVIHSSSRPLRPADWQALAAPLERVGIPRGEFHCSSDPSYCKRKGWHYPRLLLALPRGVKVKDSVVLHTYTGKLAVNSILNWANKLLMSRVSVIRSTDELRQMWLSWEHVAQPELRTVMISSAPKPPMYFSALSVRFNGRGKFGFIQHPVNQSSEIHDWFQLKPQDDAHLLILTSEMNRTYGRAVLEYRTFFVLEMWLKFVYPEINDVFICSMVIVNFLCAMQFFVCGGTLLQRMWKLMVSFWKFNLSSMLLWIMILGFLQVPPITKVPAKVVTLLRLLHNTSIGMTLSRFWIFYRIQHHLAVQLLAAYVTGIASVYYWLLNRSHETNTTQSTEGGRPQLRGIAAYLDLFFQTAGQPPASLPEFDMEDGLQLLLERLHAPALWLPASASVPPDYIRSLPVWRYQAERSEASEESNESQSSSGEEPETLRAAASTQQESLGAAASVTTDNSWQEVAHWSSYPGLASCPADLVMDSDYECTCSDGVDSDPGSGHSSPLRHRASSLGEIVDHELATRKRDLDRTGRRRRRRTRGRRTSPKKASLVCSRTEPAEAGEVVEKPIRDSNRPVGMLPDIHDCPICIDQYADGDALCGLPCGHVHHQKCLMHWLLRDHHLCPVCRWPSYVPKEAESEADSTRGASQLSSAASVDSDTSVMSL